MHRSRSRLLRIGLEFHVCTINKSAHTKMSGNLFNESCKSCTISMIQQVHIYIYIYMCVCVCVLHGGVYGHRFWIFTYIHVFSLSVNWKGWSKRRECEKGRVLVDVEETDFYGQNEFFFLLNQPIFLIAKDLFDVNMVCFLGLYGISTFVGYLTPNPFLCK